MKRNILAPAPLARLLGAGLSVLLLALYLYGGSLLEYVELKTYDMRLRTLVAPAARDVTIAAIDEASLVRLGRWPWSRETLARLVERLEQAGARVIGFDVFFAEAESVAADRRLARAIGAGGKTVLGTVFLFDPEEARHMGAERQLAARRAIETQALREAPSGGAAQGQFPMPTPHGVIANLPSLQQSAAYAGHINVVPDADGTLRRVPLVVRYEGRYYPSFDLQAARAFLGGAEPVVHTAVYGVAGLELGGRFVPTDEYGRLLVRYRGPERTFDTVSIADILGRSADPALLRDRVVVIGSTAKGIGDIRVTPYGPAYPGIELRASVIQNLIDGEYLQRPEWMSLIDLGVIVLLALVLLWQLPRLGVRGGALLALGLLGAYLLFASHVFRAQGLWLNTVYPVLLTVILFVSSTLVHYFSSESEKRHLRTAFQHYVPATVIDEIVADVGKLRLGGDKRELTVLFSDIRGFTTLSEALAPEDLVRLLNVYFTEMTRKVFDHKGSLDKYIGDAIMAVFGAPVPDAQHARQACRAALDMITALGALQAQWQRDGLPRVDIGVGINSGPMIVGNMGSVDRFNYTVIGDAVNLASRIESLNKTYGTNIIISEYTYEQVKDEFTRVREIDRVQVRGRVQPVRLYELIPEGRYARLDWLAEFEDAYRLMQAGDPARAGARFGELHAAVGDPVSKYHVARCGRPQRRAGESA